VRWRYRGWTVGAVFAVDVNLATPAYRETGTLFEIFQVPGLGVELGSVIAADL
jgi:hypothetical protein